MILNLNEFKDETDEIQLGDKVYKIPKGIPEILYLDLIDATTETARTGMRKVFIPSLLTT